MSQWDTGCGVIDEKVLFVTILAATPTFDDTIKNPELRKIARSNTAGREAKVYTERHNEIARENRGYADLVSWNMIPIRSRLCFC